MVAVNLVAAVALALTLLVLPLQAQDARALPDKAAYAQLAAELGRLGGGDVAPEVVGQRLPALCPAAAELVFDVLGRDELPVKGGALVLDEREHAALLEGARRMGRAAFLPLWSEAATGADAARRRTAIELVGHCGKAVDLDTAVLAAMPLEGERADPDALRMLEEAGARLLVRAPDTLVALRPAILHAPPELAGSLIRSVGHGPDERALQFLSDLLGFDERLELPLLSEIERAARGSAPPFDERLCAQVRAYLTVTDRQLARMAAVTLSVLQDEGSLPALIELSASADAAVSGAAFLALERTSDLALPRRTDRWRAWLQSEQRWASDEGPRVAAALGSTSVPQVLAALRAVATRRLERQRHADLTAKLLEHAEPEVRLEACRTLAALKLQRMRAALERTCADPDPTVAAAAQAALHALPGV